MSKRNSQLKLLKNQNLSYGGSLLTTRKGRSGPRPISSTESMHLVLRSTKAVGEWNFLKPENELKIARILDKFSKKYFVQVISIGNVGNHLHIHLKLGHRMFFKPFIRALTGALAMAITGANRWNPLSEKFWDRRPFTRVVRGFRAMLTLTDYIEVNKLEAVGCTREQARWAVANVKIKAWHRVSGTGPICSVNGER